MAAVAEDVQRALALHAIPANIPPLQRFFKTGPGQYGEGDVFMGVKVPGIRLVAKEFRQLPLPEVQRLLESPIHEHRLCALILLDMQFVHGTEAEQTNIYNMYLQNVHENRVNNWDLVDVTCRAVVGAYLWQRPRDVLFELARSDNLWERRVAIISTFFFIGKGDPGTSLELAELLIDDPHDLMHKAVGWTLREVGKRIDRQLLVDFLDRHARTMPRTTLRYAIEHLPDGQKRHYMAQKSRA